MLRTSLALICLAGPAVAERFHAQATCSPSGMALHYACEIRLMPGGETVENAAFTVRPDMPSMPMAHNIRPVAVVATETPGLYSADIEIEMPGDWTLTLDLSAPRRDRVMLPYRFEAQADGHQATDHSGHDARGHGAHSGPSD